VGGSQRGKPLVRSVVRGSLEPPTFRFQFDSILRRREASYGDERRCLKVLPVAVPIAAPDIWHESARALSASGLGPAQQPADRDAAWAMCTRSCLAASTRPGLAGTRLGRLPTAVRRRSHVGG
jgi:hypothetical protein